MIIKIANRIVANHGYSCGTWLATVMLFFGIQGLSRCDAAPQLSIIDIGLVDSEHTSSTGARSSEALQQNVAGNVIGFSQRFSGGSGLGNSPWLYDGTSTVKIGLFGGEHTRGDGFQSNYSIQLNEAGQVIGNSDRWNGGTYFGRSAWLFDGASIANIGLTGTGHTRNDGYRYSETQLMNQGGQVVGRSSRFSGANNLGVSAWLYNGTSSVNIGLTGAEHTNNAGSQTALGLELNEAGQVLGYSFRFNGGSTNLGESVWLFNGTNTVNIGLVDTEHTRNDGFKLSSSFQSGNQQLLNEAGQAAGYALRYNGTSTQTGQSAWLYNGTSTVNIGLSGTEHTTNDGGILNNVSKLNNSGQVIGTTLRYNGSSTNLGYSAFLYNGVTTSKIGLVGAEHTRNDGYQENSVTALNEAGQVIGTTQRFNGGSINLGYSAYLYNGISTANIGLVGSGYTRDDGYQYSNAVQLNEAGQVIGASDRFDGGTYLGTSAWVFDPILNQTISFDRSIRSDGLAYSQATYLGEDGVVLGYYQLFDGLNYLGDRALYWSREDGLLDLGELIEGGLASYNWSLLNRAISTNGIGNIIGYGQVDGVPSGSRSAFLMSRISVPEPNSIVISGIGLLALIARRRKRSDTTK